ncbi:MAG: hypothetical protein JWM89_3883 [Acidimicrobiales bacterium]|nr:hypothetical protein [Acidimicrobiales bacterium]
MPSSPLNDRHYRPDDPSAALTAAASAMREAFSAIPFDAAMPRCPHCVTAAEVAALGDDPRRLPPALVGRFVIKHGTTWGGPSDLRRLMPAIFAMQADGALPVHRPVVWAKLRAAGWPDWNHEEVAAVHHFAEAEWNRLVRSEPRPAHAAHRWLAATATGIDDLDPYLAAWHDALGPLAHPAHHEAAVGHLVGLLANSPLRPDLPETMADVFPGRPHAAAQVTTWLIGPATADELQRAAAVLARSPQSRRVNVANERLRRFTAAVAAARTGSGAPSS